MTSSELMQWLEQFQGVIALWLLALPVLTYGVGALLRKASRLLARYLLAGAIYLAVVPGVCITVILLYMLLFVRVNLLHEMHLVLHLLPVVSMLTTLWAASRLEDFDHIPGFERLQGLMVLVGLSFATLLCIHKTFIGIVFFAQFEYLLVGFGVFLLVWRLGITRFFSKRRSPPFSL